MREPRPHARPARFSDSYLEDDPLEENIPHSRQQGTSQEVSPANTQQQSQKALRGKVKKEKRPPRTPLQPVQHEQQCGVASAQTQSQRGGPLFFTCRATALDSLYQIFHPLSHASSAARLPTIPSSPVKVMQLCADLNPYQFGLGPNKKQGKCCWHNCEHLVAPSCSAPSPCLVCSGAWAKQPAGAAAAADPGPAHTS